MADGPAPKKYPRKSTAAKKREARKQPTPRQSRFAKALMKSKNLAQAAIAAGYSPKNAESLLRIFSPSALAAETCDSTTPGRYSDAHSDPVLAPPVAVVQESSGTRVDLVQVSAAEKQRQQLEKYLVAGPERIAV